MSTITIFLLAFIGILIPANVLVGLIGKNNKSRARKASLETAPAKGIPREASLNQGITAPIIQRQLSELNQYIGKHNGAALKVEKLEKRQESIYSKILALEETASQIRSDVREIKQSIIQRIQKPEEVKAKPEPGRAKALEYPKSSRVRILQEYLKKV